MIQREIFRPIRARGVRLAFLIDDQLNAGPSRPAALLQNQAITRIKVAVGFYLSTPKCQLTPKPAARFLGMLVDAPAQCFLVPPDKVAKFTAAAEAALAAPTVSHRTIAQLAGTMVSFGHAIELAPLMARSVHKAHTGSEGWDELYPTPQAFQADLRIFLRLLETTNGTKSWARRAASVVAVGDASDSALAASFKRPADLPFIHVPLTPEQRQRVVAHELSSTERELMALQAVVSTLLGCHHRHLLEHGCLQYYTDSQAEMHAVLGMKGGPSTFPLVRAIRLSMASIDARLDVVWHPRTNPDAQLADYLSKLEDNSQWSLNDEVGICGARHLRSGVSQGSHRHADTGLKGLALPPEL